MIVCATCHDTHRMPLVGRMAACTYCPRPCGSCAGDHGRGAFCNVTPCDCGCHTSPHRAQPTSPETPTARRKSEPPSDPVRSAETHVIRAARDVVESEGSNAQVAACVELCARMDDLDNAIDAARASAALRAAEGRVSQERIDSMALATLLVRITELSEEWKRWHCDYCRCSRPDLCVGKSDAYGDAARELQSALEAYSKSGAR